MSGGQSDGLSFRGTVLLRALMCSLSAVFLREVIGAFYLYVYILNGILNLRRSSYTIFSDGVDIPLR